MASRSLPALPGLLHPGASLLVGDRNLARFEKLRDGAANRFARQNAVTLGKGVEALAQVIRNKERVACHRSTTIYAYVHTLSKSGSVSRRAATAEASLRFADCERSRRRRATASGY